MLLSAFVLRVDSVCMHVFRCLCVGVCRYVGKYVCKCACRCASVSVFL